jgi:hypothetical protein
MLADKPRDGSGVSQGCATLASLMGPADLRAFARRDRAPVEQLEREHWAREFREHGGLATLRAGQALYEYARRVRPDLPTDGAGSR